MRLMLVCALFLSATACTSAPPPASTNQSTGQATNQPTDQRVDGWRADLAAMVPAMARIHPRLDHGTPRAELDDAAAKLAADVPRLSDDAVMVGVLRIAALVSAQGRDGHTGVFVWGTGGYPVHSLPLRVWLFPDGVYVEDALPPARDLVGGRVEAIGGHPIAEVLAALRPLVPRDNDATVTLLTPRYLLIPEVLHGLGLLDGSAGVRLDVVDRSGARRSTDVAPVPMAEYNAWAGPYGLHLVPTPGTRYLSRMQDTLWWEPLPGSRTLYVQYNRVERLDRAELDALRATATGGTIDRVVVDLRHNYGGQVGDDDPLLDVLAGTRLFVITGRNTFSAASLFAAKLDARLPAVTFVGEPMGGAPTSYGDTEDVTLAHSGLVVTVSDLLEVATDPDDPRLTIEPTLPAPLTAADYFAGRDPALAAILAQPHSR